MVARAMGAVVFIAAECGAPDGFVFVLQVHDVSGVAVVSADGVDAELMPSAKRAFVVRREFASFGEALASPPITVEAWRDRKLVGMLEIQPGEACRARCAGDTCADLVEERREDVGIGADGKLDLGAYGCLVCSGADGISVRACP
jgi:hypothetical protein